jgi:hypothetical protein
MALIDKVCVDNFGHQNKQIDIAQSLFDYANGLATHLLRNNQQIIIILEDCSVSVQREFVAAFVRSQFHLIIRCSISDDVVEIQQFCSRQQRAVLVCSLGDLSAGDVRIYLENILSTASQYYSFSSVEFTPEFVERFVSEFTTGNAKISLRNVSRVLQQIVSFCADEDSLIVTCGLYEKFLMQEGRGALYGRV